MIKSELNLECGVRLKECLNEFPMTQNELSKLTDYTQQYISNIIVGKKPMTISAAKSFSKHLHIRQEYLLCEDDFKTWEDEENAKRDSSHNDCYCAIKYLQSLGFSIIPLTILLSSEEELDNDPYYSENKYGSSIIDQNGNIFPLMRAPWMMEYLHKDSDVVSHKCIASMNMSFIALETPDANFILSLDDFTLFLKNIDDFVKFSVHNFLNNYKTIKERYAPDTVKNTISKYTQVD